MESRINLNPLAKPFIPLGNDTQFSSDSSIDTCLSAINDNSCCKTDTSSDIYSTLKSLKLKYFNKIVIAHLNINSLRNKFELLSDMI